MPDNITNTTSELYRAPRARLLDAQTVEWQYMGIFLRLCAFLVDMVGLIVVTLVLSQVGLLDGVHWSDGQFNVNVPEWVWFAWSLVFWNWLAATPGKLLLGARIVDATTGRKAVWWRYLVRLLFSMVSGVALCIGFLWAIFDRHNRTWHDLAAGTVVVMWDRSEARPVQEMLPAGIRHQCGACSQFCWTDAQSPRADCPACGRTNTLTEV